MKDCIFCKIIEGELPGKFVYKDSDMVVFYDISPKAPIHVLLVPIKHIESFKDVTSDDKELMGRLMVKVSVIAKQLGIEEGFKITVNNGKLAGQLVYHIHIHILGGWKKSPEWEV